MKVSSFGLLESTVDFRSRIVANRAKHKPSASAARLQGPGGADAEQAAHEDAQVVGHRGHQVALADLVEATEPGPSGPAPLADMGEAPLDLFTALAL